MPHEQLDLSSNKPVLSWANHQLDNREAQMAKNVASLPFVFKHVALMPDVHLGKGALVGSVIATKDAVIPAAVGVDIGCFTGDTKVPLVDGQEYRIEDLANHGRSIYVYACTDSGKIVCAEAIARKTKSNADLIKVVLDNDYEIKCTPDHQFMLRDGNYKQAKDLKPNDSLMPFYSKVDKDGYTLIQQNYSGRWQKAHWLNARSGILGEIPKLANQRIVIHHKNFNKADNQLGLHNHRQYEHGYNHKVVSVISTVEKEDVYCLSVPDYHNFALSAGVFVHNCGMAALKLPFTGDRLEGKLKKIRHQIERSIPVGRWENKSIEQKVTNWQGWRDFKELHPGVQDLGNKAQKQLGSLGGGNHFIELCLDTENYVWLMLHSGSRHIGNKLAQCHISTGKKLAELADLSLPDPDLAYFVAGTPEFEAYWRDLQWAQDYARFNRDVMMERFKRIVEEFVTGGKEIKPLLSVNCHHNYAEKEIHFGEDVYVTRKGAVRAQSEDYGIIPGSMGTKSYIDSYCSCSHGAGRLMSRTKAKKQFTVEDVIEQTRGVECRKDSKIIDEIPGAYKPIEEVMAQQSDLVEVVATIKQVVCVKG
ncbi:MAG: hypothetical protein RLZZ499_2139 [Cyanobacteriota bacterium]